MCVSVDPHACVSYSSSPPVEKQPPLHLASISNLVQFIINAEAL